MNKLGTVINFELVRTLKKPSFWLSILAIPLLISAIIGISYFSSKTSSDISDAEQEKPFSIAVLDESGIVQDAALEQFKAERVSSHKTGVSSVKNGTKDAFFYFPADLTKQKIEIHGQHDGFLNNSKYEAVAQMILSSSAGAQVGSPNIIAAAQGSAEKDYMYYKAGERYSPIGSIIVPAAFLVLFYSVIVLLGNQMLTITTEEKENRVTEMILTSITSRTLIVGKIISLTILGVVQLLTITLPVVLVYLFARETFNIPDVSELFGSITFNPWQIAAGASLLVSGFLLFTGLLVGIGAAMPTAKEANSFFGFVILLMFVPFYFFALLMVDSGSPIVSALSFFPLTAPVTLMVRNTFDTLSAGDGIIGIGIVVVSSLIALAAAVRIFRYGTLEYGSRLSLRRVFARRTK